MAIRTIKLVIEYDGGAFSGFQRQTQAPLPTVQGALEEALSPLVGENIRIYGAGRTDAGVHALGQVVHFRTRGVMPVEILQRALNSVMAPSLAALQVTDERSDFHARHSALARRYRYVVLNRLAASAILHGRVLHDTRPLDLEAMREACRHLVGTRDFSAFRSGGAAGDNPVRMLSCLAVRRPGQPGGAIVPEGMDFGPRPDQGLDGECLWPASPDELVLMDFEADSFLRAMVRMMVGTLLRVGRGEMQAQEVEAVLASKDSAQGGPSAPAHGLYLVEVHYPK